ncbi:TraR/DksA family transcriptional regulator [Stenoxybacter acetivorans]|uniref:TraR/DksA family transcriptional regulator n=1 Tax=Stenoxybacter acetivorans TaxID=422441 RepID=UPI00056D86A4|nr:TraR/DksA family transcriptional regulator [Stenoxybacter acetivorans]
MDWADRAALNEAVFTETALARQAAKSALVPHGSGVCIECGEAIPAARLAAMPNAAYCIGCQKLFEAHPPYLP